MVLDFLKSLKVLSLLGIDLVGHELSGSSLLWVLLSVQEILWDSVIEWLGHDVVDLVNFSLSQLTGSLVEIDVSDLKHSVGESSANSLDGSEGEHDLH